MKKATSWYNIHDTTILEETRISLILRMENMLQTVVVHMFLYNKHSMSPSYKYS